MVEKTWVVHWDGPLTLDDAKKKERQKSGYVLYQLLGYHPLYGSNVLLYIGQTNAGIKTRLGQHDDWIKDEYDKVTVRLGSISEFKGWPSWKKQKRPYSSPGNTAIDVIEKLMIYANQPAYNTANKNDAKDSQGTRIFNTGHFGSLIPEISSRYFLGK